MDRRALLRLTVSPATHMNHHAMLLSLKCSLLACSWSDAHTSSLKLEEESAKNSTKLLQTHSHESSFTHLNSGIIIVEVSAAMVCVTLEAK